MRILILILTLFLLSACGRPHLGFPSALLPAACLTEPVQMSHCDFSAEPAHCQTVTLKYKRGCEQIRAKP